MRFLLPFAGLLILIALGLAVWNTYSVRNNAEVFAVNQRETNHAICLAIRNVDKEITDSVLRSKASLEAGHIQYYRTHPAERAQVIKEIDQELATFKPRTCTKS